MIDQQSGISLESLLRGILGIVTVLAVAYALSYDRKRIDWKLIGGGLIMQVIFALAVLYIPFVGTALEWVYIPDPFITGCHFLFSIGFPLLLLGNYPACCGSFFLVATKVYEYIGCGRISYLRKYIYGND